MTLNAILGRAVELHAERRAVACGTVSLSYAEFDGRVDRLARALADRGVGSGDRVAVLMLNCHRYLEAYFAVARLGAIAVPLNTRLAPPELAYILDDSGTGALLFDAAFLDVIGDLRRSAATVQTYLFAEESGPAWADRYETALRAASAPAPRPEIDENAVAGIFYTGGTTGRAKGVMLTHRNLVANALHVLVALGDTSADVYLHAAPMFHLADGARTFAVTWVGGTHAFIPGFEPKRFLEVVERERITNTILVPTMVNLLINHPDAGAHDLASLRYILYGASPMPVDLLQRAMKTLPCGFIQGYGMTETAPLLTILPMTDHVTGGSPEALRRLASCGRPVVGVEVRVVDEQDQPVRPGGQVGEIVARGPNVMKGYWGRTEETSVALRGGWMHTGDMAWVDAEGYLYIVDRQKDMIITGGENVYSTEVEGALYAHPAILEAAVIGVPDDRWGEAVKAFVVLKPGAPASEAELIAHCRTLIAGYKVPRSVEFRTGLLPKSGAGKILKRELREPYWQGQTRRVH